MSPSLLPALSLLPVRTRKLLSTPVAARGNRPIAAHRPDLMDLIGYLPRNGRLVSSHAQGANRGASFPHGASVASGAWPQRLG